VAESRANALREVLKLTRKGARVSPVKIAGRTIASTFWGKAWCDNLESYSDFSNRLPRGRTYVRNGSVVDLQIEPGKVTSLVSGSSLYRITICIRPLAAPRWKELKAQCGRQIGSLVELLQGRLSKSVMEIVTQRESGLFPAPDEIEMSCSCPDWADMCKHVAATLYAVGSRLDHGPELFFKLRQADHLELIAQAARPETKSKNTERKRIATDQLAEVFGIELEAHAKVTHPIRAAQPVRARQLTPSEEKRANRIAAARAKEAKASVSRSKPDSRSNSLGTATRKLSAKALKNRRKGRQQATQSADKIVPSTPVPAIKTAKAKSVKSAHARHSRQR
jgi:uncharacterized Zn finger protein